MKTAVSNKLRCSEYLSAGFLPKITSRLTLAQEADSTICLDNPQMRESLSGNSNNKNRYDEET